MIIVDSSVLVAIFEHEADAGIWAAIIPEITHGWASYTVIFLSIDAGFR